MNRSAETSGSSAVSELAALGTKILALSLEGASEWVRQSSAFWINALSGFPFPGMGSRCCDIPEQDCPPRCSCTIAWEATRGQRRKASIRVTNTSNQARNFTFQTTPFVGASKELPGPAITPASAFLQPGQSMSVTAEAVVSESFDPGLVYESELLISGSYIQRVCFVLHVAPEKIPFCAIEHGEPPIRIRAHQWYDHFQCIEPCAPMRSPNDRETVALDQPVAVDASKPVQER